jgi:phage terminase large subunit-like protein
MASGTGFQGPGKRLLNDATPPWKEWKLKTRHARAIKFIETYCRAPKGKGHGVPLKLARFQKEFLEAALSKDVDASVLTTPRGNGKSTFGGALAVWALVDDDETGSPQVPIAATTITQAIRSCYGVAVAMIKAEPELANRTLIYTGISTPRVVYPFNGGEMFPISNEKDGLQGLDPSLAIVDEIGFQPVESWSSLRLASGKRERSLIVGVGTSGFDEENALSNLRATLAEGGVIKGLVYREYSTPDGTDLHDRAAWRRANPAIAAGFLRIASLETEVKEMPEALFRIFRLNQFGVRGVDSWLGPNGAQMWKALIKPYDFVDKAPTWIGLDVGLKRDSTAVVHVQKDDAGELHARAKLWVPTEDAPVDVTDVMQYIRELAKQYDVEAISFDPRFFDVPAKMLSDEGLPMVQIDQSPERMTPIVGTVLELIKSAGLHHDGDEQLATHVLNAVPRFNDRGFTLQKAKSKGRIDACIALALAVDRAIRQDTTKGWFAT